jgi:elongation factor P
MIDVNQLRKKTTFLDDDGQIWKVMDFSHHKPGRGNATIRLTVRNLRTGTIRDLTYNSGERVQDIEVESHNVEYLYADADLLTFMDRDTFEQPQLSREAFGDDLLYLREGMMLRLFSYDGEVIDYELPPNVEQQIVEADSSYTGNTATAAFKRAVTETGLVVQVPPFVNAGDTIRVSTDNGSYVTRV